MSKYRVFYGPYFPVFGLYVINLNTGKYGPEKTPYLDTFHEVHKSHQRKPRKGENNIWSESTATLNIAENNTLTDPELDVEKQLEFSEYWHNEEKFYVHQILDYECKKVKRCESCKVDFPKENQKIGSDLVVVHKKRYMCPNFDSVGERGEPILTT